MPATYAEIARDILVAMLGHGDNAIYPNDGTVRDVAEAYKAILRAVADGAKELDAR